LNRVNACERQAVVVHCLQKAGMIVEFSYDYDAASQQSLNRTPRWLPFQNWAMQYQNSPAGGRRDPRVVEIDYTGSDVYLSRQCAHRIPYAYVGHAPDRLQHGSRYREDLTPATPDSQNEQ
jgi:hypothetical protein